MWEKCSGLKLNFVAILCGKNCAGVKRMTNIRFAPKGKACHVLALPSPRISIQCYLMSSGWISVCSRLTLKRIFGSNCLHLIAHKSRQNSIIPKNTINCTNNSFDNEGDFRFLCNVETFEINPHVVKFQIFPHLSCIEIWNFST